MKINWQITNIMLLKKLPVTSAASKNFKSYLIVDAELYCLSLISAEIESPAAL